MIMADYEADLSRLEAQFVELEGTMAGLEGVTSTFRSELEGVLRFAPSTNSFRPSHPPPTDESSIRLVSPPCS
ncbi:MAG TPA: hypothetical protein PLH75_02650 [Amaricoccus sp.]|nr:hypothetical protein [Amaricoccus sp.]